MNRSGPLSPRENGFVENPFIPEILVIQALHDLRLSGSRDDDGPWTDRRVAMASWAFVAMGVLLRIARYALDHPLWGDEAFLASNILARDFRGLMRPLDYVQVCPLLFLWIEKAMTRLFGFSEWSLRAVPTLASIAGLVLFRQVASRLLRGPALVIAVGVLAVGYYPVRHGGEIKPYATDFLAAIALIAPAVEWLRRPDRSAWLWGLAAVGPVAVALSHPAIFVAGGVGLVLLGPVARTKRPGAILALAAYGLATLLVFGGLLRLVTASQSASVMGTMKDFWADAFPPKAPLALLTWLLRVHTSHMFAYPAGGNAGASVLTSGCALAALIAYLRRGSRPVLALLLAPFALGLAAAFLGRYPYGGSARTMQYVAPSIALLAGLGAAVLAARWPRRESRSLVAAAPIAILAAIGPGLLAWDVTHPYKSIHDRESRDFARLFWDEESRGAELACGRADLALDRDPVAWRNDRSALYLCHRDLFSARHRRGEPLRLDRVGADRPLRVVVFGEREGDRPKIASWLATMDRDFVLRARRERVVNRGLIDREGTYEDRYAIYEFVPRSSSPPETVATGQNARLSR